MPKAAVPQIVLKDFSGAAAGFFANTKMAASLVLGTSLGALFVLSSFSSETSKTKLELFLIKAYRMLTWLAFVLSLNTVITCTVATSSTLHGRFDPMAETSYLMLKREFEYEFVSIRWSMLVCLLLFLVVVTLRLLLEFQLLSDPRRANTMWFVLSSSIGLLAHLLSYINEHLYCWNNLAEMTVDLATVVATRIWEKPSILKLVTVVSAVGSAYFGIRSALTSHAAHPEDAPDDGKSKSKAD